MDQSTFDALERLSKLHADGVLSAAEYEAEKTRVLSMRASTPASTSAASPPPEPPIDEASLAPVWRERFRYIDEAGMPTTRAYSEAMRRVPFVERMRLVISPVAFLFGPFYFVYLGLWRPALSLFGALFVTAVIADTIGVPAWLDRSWYVIPGVIYAWTCIPLYYLRVRRGIHSWNPMVWWGAERA